MITNDSMQEDGGLSVLAFKVQSLQFDLNRDLQYVSMKDQIIRGRTLVLAASHAGLFGPQTDATQNRANIVIIGGGIGGISAALMACELNLSAIVIEPSGKCFPVLGMGSDRLFSATVYDWPHAHFSEHHFPHISALRGNTALQNIKNALVLSFPSAASTAAKIRTRFLNQLKGFEKTYRGKLSIRNGQSLQAAASVTVNDSNGGVTVKIHRAATDYFIECDLIVFSMGFGRGKSSVQTKAASEFFSYKDLESDVQNAVKSKKIIRIIGGGDGGLQEALRFMLSAKYQDLSKAILKLSEQMKLDGLGLVWAALCEKILSAEDHATKSLMWGYKEDVVFSELEEIYKHELATLFTVGNKTIESWHAAVGRKQELEIQLIDTLPFSKRVYGLNRFLTLLLLRLSAPDRANLKRLTTVPVRGRQAIEITRVGFASQDQPTQIGTANGDDLLRRLVFRGIPMNLDTVV